MHYPQSGRRAVLWLPVLIALGIGVYFLQKTEPGGGRALIAAIFGGALILAGIAIRQSYLRLLLIGMACICAGYSAAKFRTMIAGTPVLERSIAETRVTGTIRDAETGARGQKVIIDVDSIDGLSRDKTPKRVRLTWRASLDKPEIGARVHLTARLWPLPRPVAPGGFDFGRKLFFQGVGAFGQVKSVGEMSRDHNGLQTRIRQFRRNLAGNIAARIDGQAGAVAAALVTGDRSRISAETKNDLRAAGLAHLLAISGLHMGLAVGVVFFAMRAVLALFPPLVLRFPIKKWAAGTALAAGAGYLVLSGASIPTVRAFIMAAIALAAIMVDRQAISLRTVAIAATLILLAQPEALVQAGFQMSFAAVVALVTIYEMWGRRASRMGREAGGVVSRSGSAVFGIGMTSLIAGLATAPFAAAHFNRLTAFGLLGNLAAMPVMALLIMPSAVLACLLMPLGLSQPAWTLMGLGIGLVLDISHWIATLPGAETLIASPPGWTLPVIAAGGLAFAIHRKNTVRIAASGLALAGLSGFVVPDRPEILAGRWGQTIAIRGDSGELFVAGLKPRSYDAKQWLRRDGRRAAGEGFSSCSAAGECQLPRGLGTLIIAGEGADIRQLCRNARIVIASFRTPIACPQALLLDPGDFSRYGNVVIDPQSLDVVSVADSRGRRPWASSRYRGN